MEGLVGLIRRNYLVPVPHAVSFAALNEQLLVNCRRRLGDTIAAPPLIEGISFGALLGDLAFGVDWLRAGLDSSGAFAVIPPKASTVGINYDREMYRWRHLIENFFAKLTEFRAIATCYAKNDISDATAISSTAVIIAFR